MVVVLHLLVALFCALECGLALLDIRGRLTKLFMFSALGLIHGLAPAMTPADLQIAEFSYRSRLSAAALALVGVILFSLGWRMYDATRPPLRGVSAGLQASIVSVEGQALLRRLFWLCGVCGVAAWFGSVVAGGTAIGDVFHTARFAYRRTEVSYLEAIAQYFVILAMIPGFICFFLPRRYRAIGIGYSLSMALLLFLASQGTRANAVGLLGCLLMGYALRHRLHMRRVLTLGVGGLVLLLLSVSLYDVRKTMMRQTLPEMLQTILSPATYRGAMMHDPLNYHQFLVAAVEFFPDRHPFLNGATYRRLFVFYLPRRSFESVKPEDPNMIFAAVVDPGSARELTTIPPTMMGDGYINFWGWPGIGIMLINGMVFGLVSWKMRTNMLWFVAMGALYVRLASVAVRGQPYEVLLLGLWGLVAVWFLGTISGFPFCKSRIAGNVASESWSKVQPAH